MNYSLNFMYYLSFTVNNKLIMFILIIYLESLNYKMLY